MTDPQANTGPPTAPEPTAPSGPPLSPSGDRPAPRLDTLLGAGAGLLLLVSLSLFLSELGGDKQRIGGIVIALLFEVIGVALLVLDRDRRSSTAGVTLTAVGVVPLLVYLFVDVRHPGDTIDSAGSFTSTATGILLVAAGLWLAAYFFGPGRRFAFYLGAALLALWLVSVVQILNTSVGRSFDGFGPTALLSPGITDAGGSAGTGQTDSFGNSGSSTFGPDDFNSDDFNSSDQFTPNPVLPGENGGRLTDSGGRTNDPTNDLGVASLLFGGTYLAAAAWRDHRRDQRQATALLAVALPILSLGVFQLRGELEPSGAAVLAIVLGTVAAFMGTRAHRRFTSWYGTFAAAVGIVVLVAEAIGDSARASALALLVLGLAAAVAASRFPGAEVNPAARLPRSPEGRP